MRTIAIDDSDPGVRDWSVAFANAVGARVVSGSAVVRGGARPSFVLRGPRGSAEA